MKFISNGTTIEIPPRGPAGPDGNPIGTVISYMGVSAPKDYLVCDGTVYPVSEYPELAEFFREQFGAVNYFGGDGTTDFAVPDMRNLFLRGYHGEAEEPLSGEIGVKQDATELPYLSVEENYLGWYGRENLVKNPDTLAIEAEKYSRVSSVANGNSTAHPMYTTRPVNMAVLYCVKAKESLPAEAVWSTEERRIGTWIDGRPVYQKVLFVTLPNSSDTVVAGSRIPNIGQLVSLFSVCTLGDGVYTMPYMSSSGTAALRVNLNGELVFIATHTAFFGKPIVCVAEYTKTTDPEMST